MTAGVVDKSIKINDYTPGEEVANSVSHGIGIVLSIAALVIMVAISVSHGGGLALAGAIVYGISMIAEYTASTLYHAVTNERAKRIFKVVDHSCIYLLIAGTYTPICLTTLLPVGGLLTLAIVWVLAIVGIATEAFWTYRPRWINTVIYVLMGWICVFQIPAMFQLMPAPGFWLLLAGGVVYTLGCVFYLAKKVKYMHSVFHVFVLAASVCQFLCVALYVL